MNTGEFIKSARQRCRLTQQDLSEMIDVSITSIQNWEKDTLPDNRYWPMLIKVLRIDKKEFANMLVNDVIPEETNISDFPDILFKYAPVEDLEKIKNIRLTADEQELLGLQLIYCGLKFDMKAYHESYSIGQCFGNTAFLPYEYVRRTGIFRVLALKDSLACKTGEFYDFISKCVLENPGHEFDMMKCSPRQFLEFCQCLKASICKREGYNNKQPFSTFYSEIMDVISKLQKIKDRGGSVAVRTTSYDIYHYDSWKDTEEAGKFHYPEGACHDKYMCEVEKECDEPDYLEVKTKYEEDLKFYNEHASMMDHVPAKPKYKGTVYVEMTEEGKELLEWYESWH